MIQFILLTFRKLTEQMIRPSLALQVFEKRILIIKDSDFLESFLLVGLPEKLLLVKTGNIRNVDLLIIFDRYIDKICSLLDDSSLLELNRSEIIVHT